MQSRTTLVETFREWIMITDRPQTEDTFIPERGCSAMVLESSSWTMYAVVSASTLQDRQFPILFFLISGFFRLKKRNNHLKSCSGKSPSWKWKTADPGGLNSLISPENHWAVLIEMKWGKKARILLASEDMNRLAGHFPLEMERGFPFETGVASPF